MGLTIYSSDAFDLAHDRLTGIGDGLAALEGRLAGIEWFPAGAADTLAADGIRFAAMSGESLAFFIGREAGVAVDLADRIALAKDWYESAEASVVSVIETVSDQMVAATALFVGEIALLGVGGLLAYLATPAGLITAVGLFGAGALLQKSGVLPSNEQIAAGATETLTAILRDPATIDVIRHVISGSDEIVNAIALRAGLIPGIGPLAGAVLGTVLGPTAVRSPQDVAGLIANGVLAQKGPSQFAYTATTSASPTKAPTNASEIVGTIPPTVSGEPQVGIIEYAKPDGGTVFVVSIAGTSSTDLGGVQPFDNLSNGTAYAGMTDIESVQATIEAMKLAGIEDGDEVVLVGYSQGALVAGALAGSGRWDTQSVVLTGSPVHGNDIPGGMAVLQLEHSNDLITSAQGIREYPHGDVTLAVRTPDVPLSNPDPFATHSFAEYLETAAQVDAEPDELLQAQVNQVVAPLEGAVAVQETHVTIERVVPDPPADPNAPVDPGPSVFEQLQPERPVAKPFELPDDFVLPTDPPLLNGPAFNPPSGGGIVGAPELDPTAPPAPGTPWSPIIAPVRP